MNSVSDTSTTGSDIILLAVSVLLPPLGVAIAKGLGGAFVLNIILTLLGYIPGLVHAVWITARR